MKEYRNPRCRAGSVVLGERYRICVLTERMLRLEYHPEGAFVDDATQMVVNREFPETAFAVERKEGLVRIETNALVLTYNEQPFSGQGLSVLLKENGFVWHYGNLYGFDGNLLGTARTLDDTSGIVQMEKGIFSRTGCVALDDSSSALIKERSGPEERPECADRKAETQSECADQKAEMMSQCAGRTAETETMPECAGRKAETRSERADQKAEPMPECAGRKEEMQWECEGRKAEAKPEHMNRKAEPEIVEREPGGTDLYFFGFGTDFFGGLREFYTLTGRVPMLPRYALGNWWSRYHRYTEESYLQMMDSFAKEEIPLSVAVIDMDWHITEVDPKYGNGWTGFSWNRELFPDPKRFLRALHARRLAVTLNLHPADGIRAFEDMYPAAAACVGVDPATEAPVPFDLSDETLRKAYFEEVLHPYEADGVDFWWIDWQQGTKAGKSKIDPLWLLNHYHFMDQAGRGTRPMIFSRYAGVGSHRYPIGFSGDTRCTWESLDIQPCFTSTASNIGYGWWSHDIGGHMMGDKDTERLTRWVQFGVFSPIMRLHSSSNPFFVKEPWKLGEPYRAIVTNFLRLRHRLIPYLYTMNELSWREGLPLIQPAYYRDSGDEAAYDAPNQYYFGTELMVLAITRQMDPALRMASVNGYLPDGKWYDVFTGRAYRGRRKRNFYRKLDRIPVLLREGGILPMAAMAENAGEGRLLGVDLPESFDLYVGFGANGSFTLFEDDGCSEKYLSGAGARTRIEAFCEEKSGRTRIVIHPAEGDTELLPKKRRWRIHLLGAKGTAETVEVAGGSSDARQTGGEETASKDCAAPETAFGEDVLFEEGTAVVRTMTTDTAAGGETIIEECAFAGNDRRREVFDLLEYAWIGMNLKENIYSLLCAAENDEAFLRSLSEMDIPLRLRDAVGEIFCDQ